MTENSNKKTTNSRRQRREVQLEHRKHKTGWMWHLPLALIVLGIAFLIVFIWHNKDQQKVDTFETAQKQLLKQQRIADFSEEKVQEKRLYTVTFYPKNEKFTKEQPLIEEKFQEMKVAFQKKHKIDAGTTWIKKIEKHVLNPKMNKILLSSQFFTWNQDKEKFHEQPLQQSALLLSSETGQTPSAKQIIGSDENLLTIKPLVQQKILEQVKAPDKVIDQVLNLKNLNMDQKMKIQDNQLKITLDKKIGNLKTVSLPLNLVLPYIDQNYAIGQNQEQLPGLDPNKKYVALTFDDGPKAQTTNQLLDILAAQQVKATFFMLGSSARQYPEVVKRAASEGHEIGSHSNVHNNLRSMAPDAIKTDIHEADKSIYLAGGQLPKILRPPYGAINSQGAQVIDKAIIQWNIDSRDWELRNTPLIVQHVLQTVQPGSIILMHDIYQTTIDAVTPIIEQLRAKGYEFVTVDQLLQYQDKPRMQYFSQDDARTV